MGASLSNEQSTRSNIHIVKIWMFTPLQCLCLYIRTYVCLYVFVCVCVCVEHVHTNSIDPQCQYTAEAPSELCRKESHRLVRFKATKKFFECKDCTRRTVTYDKTLPSKACMLVLITLLRYVACQGCQVNTVHRILEVFLQLSQ